MYKILIAEDDDIIAKSIYDSLKSWNYQPKTVSDFQNVIKEFKEFQPHLVLMDISLPFFNGYHWCGEIRKISNVPVIFLTSKEDEIDELCGLRMGADDYIKKPFSPNLLIARIKTLIRRTDPVLTKGADNQEEDVIIKRGALEMNKTRHLCM